MQGCLFVDVHSVDIRAGLEQFMDLGLINIFDRLMQGSGRQNSRVYNK
jgi:hypothetical protein